MRILITGGAGFIGSNFVHHILEKYNNYQVFTLDLLTYAGNKENLSEVLNHPRHEFIEGDIRDKELVSELVQKVNVVINFAAESHVDRSIESAKPFVSTNVQGTQTILDAAVDAELELFIQVSTDEVYGEIIEGKFGEDDQLQPRNPYAATKSGADLLAKSYYTTHDIPVTITRTCNNFGPRQHEEKLIPKFIKKAIAGENLPLYGDGSNIREWIYVKDNCRAIDLVMHNGTPGEIYNIGSGVERTNLEVTRTILNAVGGSEQQITFVEDRLGHDQRYALRTDKIRNLGWEPMWGFEAGLKETISYYSNE